MKSNENKVTIIRNNGVKGVHIPFNTHLVISKGIAIQTLAILSKNCPLEMSKSIITETSTHVDLKVNLPYMLCEILANNFKKYGSDQISLDLCVNNN